MAMASATHTCMAGLLHHHELKYRQLFVATPLATVETEAVAVSRRFECCLSVHVSLRSQHLDNFKAVMEHHFQYTGGCHAYSQVGFKLLINHIVLSSEIDQWPQCGFENRVILNYVCVRMYSLPFCRVNKNTGLSPVYLFTRSSFGVSDQQSVGSRPGCYTCVLKQDT